MEQRQLVFNKWLYRRLPYFLRRRLTPQQSPFIIVVLLAFLVIFLQTLSFISNDHQNELKNDIPTKPVQVFPKRKPTMSKITGILTENLKNYLPNSKNEFKCLAEDKIIPFEWVNDDFCDCDQKAQLAWHDKLKLTNWTTSINSLVLEIIQNPLT